MLIIQMKIPVKLALYQSQDSGIDDLLQLEKAYIQVAEDVKPWVVTITSAKIFVTATIIPGKIFLISLEPGQAQGPGQDRSENTDRKVLVQELL